MKKGLRMVKILTAKEAVETYFYSGATVTFGGFANGLMHPDGQDASGI